MHVLAQSTNSSKMTDAAATGRGELERMQNQNGTVQEAADILAQTHLGRRSQDQRVRDTLAALREMRASLEQSSRRLEGAQTLVQERHRAVGATVEDANTMLAKLGDALDAWTVRAFGNRVMSFEDAHKGISEEERKAVFDIPDIPPPQKSLVGPPGPTLETLAFKLARGDFENVIVMVGAGISVSAGIPDFRSRGTGLYDAMREDMAADGLERPEDLFSIDFFTGPDQGRAFAQRAKHVMPDKRYKPTPTHHFLKLLHGITRRRDDGTVRSILRRVYTQNIDTLEQQVGLPDEVLVNAHGSFADAHCTHQGCRRQMLLPSASCACIYLSIYV